MSPLCNLNSPRYHQGVHLVPLSWGPPQGWAHLLPQDYNGNLPSYIRSKQKLYNCQEPNGETGSNEEEVRQLFERRTGASNSQNEGSPPLKMKLESFFVSCVGYTIKVVNSLSQ